MQIPEPSQKFSNLQLELLRLYEHDVDEEELLKVKDFIGKMFLQKLSDKANFSLREKEISPDQLEQWLNEKS
ncbi:MAG: hypothetical protein JWR18_3438 [Segetibacter sp.]|jgi:hypothetical protein|nr:hypothetical protein [Segetibacter sp.]